MISDYRCFFCLVKSFEKLLEKESVSLEAKNRFVLDMVSLYLDRHEKASSESRSLPVIFTGF